MGFLTIFRKSNKGELKSLPAGTFTMDSRGRVVSSTIPQSMSAGQVREIGQHILAIFNGARTARVPLYELVVNYGVFKITAREMRGGAIVFLAPAAASSAT
ncbi:MAG TPA: hypothetical protein VHB20_18750 [Verrucomicrobiae bacterium]|jgi:hypothetical protein|nr:hypothetical protein [Verrucomicrobiae bacterium]